MTTLDPAYPNPETLAAEVEPWLRECGSCDAGLPMGCTCPPGDYRVVLLKVWRAHQASRVLVAEEIAAEIDHFQKALEDAYAKRGNIADDLRADAAEYCATIARSIGIQEAS